MAHFDCNFISYTLGRAVSIKVILPTIVSPKIQCNATHHIKYPYPVLYLLHGGANDYTSWTQYTSIERYVEERQIAVVTFSTENKAYIDFSKHIDFPFSFGTDNFFTFVDKELREFVTEIFPISKNPEENYMAGLSMGGFGTMLHAFHYPEKYRAIGILSPMVSLNLRYHEEETGNPVLDQWNPVLICKKSITLGKKLPDIFFSTGESDFMYEAQLKLKQFFDKEQIAYTWEILDGYGHEWAFWDKQIERFLNWIPRSDEYCKGTKIRNI